jgi:chromosomal replication initiation ATPase DnaA
MNQQERLAQIMESIQGNMDREDFQKYIAYCVKKWDRLKVEMEVVDVIISSICKQWGVSKSKLIEDKKLAEPRALTYYIIKKEINLSYAEIGEIFGINKSYIHKAITDVSFLVEKHGQENLVNMFNLVQNELLSKNGNVLVFDVSKSDNIIGLKT